MQLMIRDREIGDLVSELSGKRVLILTCNTCARLCGVGGTEAAKRLGTALSSAGICITGVKTVTAACIKDSVDRILTDVPDADMIVALMCSVGATVIGLSAPCIVINPIVTLGTGFEGDKGSMILIDAASGSRVDLDSEAERRGLHTGPFA